MNAFDYAIAFTLSKQIEGGYVNDPTDRGGETNFGITNSTFLSSQQNGIISTSIPSVKYITQQDAINIYKASYWSNNNLDEVAKISPALSVAIFDFVVN